MIHRDIKPSNILYDPVTGEIRICDFGSAAYIWENGGEAYYGGGSPAFMAPELFDSSGSTIFSTACDVFGLGATLFCMWSGAPPWGGKNQLAHAGNLIKLELQFPPHLDPINPHLRHLLCGMLEKESAARITICDIINHDWITAEGSERLQ